MKKQFSIKGMHCNSCSQLIENALKDKVNSINVSYASEKAEIDFDEQKISEKDIKEIIEKLGYSCANENIKEKKSKAGWIILVGSSILLLAVLYLLIRKYIPETNIPGVGENTGLILLFAAGLLTGFHCIAMCGGFVVSYTAKNAIKGHKSFKQHLVYGGSKVVSYAIIGGVFGLIGGVIAFSAGLRGWVAIIAGVFMIFYALGMFGIKAFRFFQLKPKFLTKIATQKHEGVYMGPLVTGLLNGLFIACGPLQAMYLYAAGSGSWFSGMTSLAAFGLGTLPVMLGFGSLATVISHKTTGKILKISAVIVIILGLVMINRGLSLTGSSLSYESIKAQIAGAGAASASSNVVNGIQEINMDVDASGYHPNSFVLKQGVPVKWNINVKQLTSCNSELIATAYNIDVKLKQGLQTVQFTPDKTGNFQFSCGMGMLHGSFIVTDTGTADASQVKAATPSSGMSCNMGSNGGSCGCMG